MESNFLITGILNAILNKNMVPKKSWECEKCGRQFQWLKYFKAHTCDSAKPPHFKKNKQKKSSTLTYEPSSNHIDKISSSAYSYDNDINLLNTVDVSLISDYFDDGSIALKFPTMLVPTSNYEIFTDTDTVWELNIIKNQSYWKHLDNEVLGKVCFHICSKLQFKK